MRLVAMLCKTLAEAWMKGLLPTSYTRVIFDLSEAEQGRVGQSKNVRSLKPV